MEETRLKVVIVDDEKIIRDGLKHVLDWEKNGYEIVGMASNGKEALELCMHLEPDIVITDIVMPLMNGLEFISEIRKRLPDTGLIILTCHEEFSYAQEAVKLGVGDYILKHSINYEDLLKVLGKIKEQRYKKEQTETKIRALEDNHAESSEIIRNDLLKRMILGRALGEEEIAAKLQGFDLMKDENLATLIVLEFKKNDAFTVHTNNLFKFPASGFDSFKRVFFPINEKRCACVILTTLEEYPGSNGKLYKELTDFMKTLKQQSGILAITAVEDGIRDYAQLHNVYQKLEGFLKHKFYLPWGSIINSRNTTDYRESYKGEIYKRSEHFQKAVIEKDYIQIDRLLEYTVKLCISESILPEVVIKDSVQFLAGAVAFFNQMGGMLQDIYDVGSTPYNQVLQAESIYEVAESCKDFFHRMMGFLTTNNAMKHQKELSIVMSIINREYDKDITLKDISKRINISYNYLVSIFRHELGIGFMDHLTGVRIQKAKEFLLGTDMKVYEIAEKVGYRDPSQLCNNFKKIEGITPAEFKQKCYLP